MFAAQTGKNWPSPQRNVRSENLVKIQCFSHISFSLFPYWGKHLYMGLFLEHVTSIRIWSDVEKSTARMTELIFPAFKGNFQCECTIIKQIFFLFLFSLSYKVYDMPLTSKGKYRLVSVQADFLFMLYYTFLHYVYPHNNYKQKLIIYSARLCFLLQPALI